jgi:hypothetical protein
MTFAEAAHAVLKGSRSPLSAQEITDRALRRGLLVTQGRTPVATMTAALYRLPRDGTIRRSFEPGRAKAARNSVRWYYVRESDDD